MLVIGATEMRTGGRWQAAIHYLSFLLALVLLLHLGTSFFVVLAST